MALEGFEEIDEVRNPSEVSGTIEEIPFEQALEEAKINKYLNVRTVKENKIKKVEILEVLRSYKRVYKSGENPVINIDLRVKANGEEYIFTVRKSNLNKLKEAFGNKKEDWIGKTIRLTVVSVGNNEWLVVDEE